MSRAWRIEYEGAYYHLLSRGNEGGDIFINEKDRIVFLDTNGEMSERFEMDVQGYVLMDNHLMVRTRQANLKKAIHWFGTAYTQRYNRQPFCNRHLFLSEAASRPEGRIHEPEARAGRNLKSQIDSVRHLNPARIFYVGRIIKMINLIHDAIEPAIKLPAIFLARLAGSVGRHMN